MYFVVGLTWVVGAGSIVLFIVFLSGVRVGVLDLHLNDGSLFAFDAGLCLLFFVQHSLLIRRPVRRWLTRFVPEHCYALVYAITSGLALIALVLLWQRTITVVYALRGGVRFVPPVLLAVAVVGFVLGRLSLKRFDALGIEDYRAHVRGEKSAQTPLAIAGMYRFMRHPLYTFAIVAIWATAEFSADRLLLNVLFTIWILAGAALEERDLAAEFGDDYRRYQRAVPMWIPRPRRRAEVSTLADTKLRQCEISEASGEEDNNGGEESQRTERPLKM